MNAFDLKVCQRLPLADVTLRLLQYATAPQFLAEVFRRHRGRAYEGVVSFPLFVRLIFESLLGSSARQTFLHAQEDASLTTSVQAMYGKLRRVPLKLSMGLFAEAAARLREVGSGPAADPLPASLANFWALAFDGKKLKYVAHRLKSLRGLKGNIYGGKLLVVQDLATEMAVVVEAAEDGETGDNPLVPYAVEQVRAMPDERARLFMGDRAFCDYPLLANLATDEDHFVVRHNASCPFYADLSVAARDGVDPEGRAYRDEIGWLGKEGHRHRIRVRKVTVTRTDTEDPLAILSSLEDQDLYPANDLLQLYRRRWGIETMFQKVVETFDLRHLIGGTGKATVFQAVICLLLYNITLMVRDYVTAQSQQPVSLGLLFDDVLRDLTAWKKMLSLKTTLSILETTANSAGQKLRTWLESRLNGVWTNRWRRSPTRKQPKARTPRAYLCGGHSSVYKIQHGLHREVSLEAVVDSGGRSIPPHEKSKDV